LEEMWILVNSELEEEEIEAEKLVNFVRQLAQIAIYSTKRQIERLKEPNDRIKRTQRQQCLPFLEKAQLQIE